MTASPNCLNVAKSIAVLLLPLHEELLDDDDGAAEALREGVDVGGGGEAPLPLLDAYHQNPTHNVATTAHLNSLLCTILEKSTVDFFCATPCVIE